MPRKITWKGISSGGMPSNFASRFVFSAAAGEPFCNFCCCNASRRVTTNTIKQACSITSIAITIQE
jgi:hypothetical protein